MKIFNLDSPIMQALSTMADLLLLNFLAGVCCIPIFTIGASMTALHYMSLKIVRNEGCYIVKGFFKAFKDNFKKATIIWLIFFAVILFLLGDLLIMDKMGEDFNGIVRFVITIVGVITTFTVTFIFPILSKFEYTVSRTIKNAFAISVLQFPRTILMMIMNVAPWVILMIDFRVGILCILFGLSVPSYVNAMIYNGYFKKLEAQIIAANAPQVVEEATEDTERIFHDEVDEGISIDSNRYQ